MCMDNCIKRYENKIVLVTGAGRGIGAAIAARFAKEGAVVIVNYSGNDEAADRTVETFWLPTERQRNTSVRLIRMKKLKR